MTDTTTETMKVDGVSLNTYAYNIQTWTGRTRSLKKVGSNILIPYRHGQVWTPKTYDQRTITLAMWVSAETVDGVVPGAGPRAGFNDNVRALHRLFAVRSRLLQLERKLNYSTGLETHTAAGEVVDAIDHTVVGLSHSTFSVDLILPDPFWYGPALTVVDGVRTNPGDVEASQMVITFTGGTNPRLTNSTTGVWVQWVGDATVPVVIDTGAFTATQGGGAVIGGISHAGAYPWMVLAPGANTLVLTGGGAVSLTYKPPYI